MRTNDQYFKPGDKVMRVGCGDISDAPSLACDVQMPQYGVVYCIEDFFEGPRFNVVMLVGFGGWRYSPSGLKVGWQATAFRKVEEIKLCISALAKAEKPSTVT